MVKKQKKTNQDFYVLECHYCTFWSRDDKLLLTFFDDCPVTRISFRQNRNKGENKKMQLLPKGSMTVVAIFPITNEFAYVNSDRDSKSPWDSVAIIFIAFSCIVWRCRKRGDVDEGGKGMIPEEREKIAGVSCDCQARAGRDRDAMAGGCL